MAAMPLRPGEGGGVFRPEPPAQDATRIVRVAQGVLLGLYPDEVLPLAAATPAQIFEELRKVVHLHKDDPQLAAQLVDALDRQEYVLAMLYLKGGVRLTDQQLASVLGEAIEDDGINYKMIPPPDTLVALIRNDLFETTNSPGFVLFLLIMYLQRNEQLMLNKTLFDLPQVLQAYADKDYTPDQNKLRLAISLNLHEEVRLLLAQGIKLPPASRYDVEIIQNLILFGRLEMLERVLQSGGIRPDFFARREILHWLVDSRSPHVEAARKLLVQAGWEQ